MSKTLIIAEKLSVACKLGALGSKIFGSFSLSNGTKLTPEYLSKNEKLVHGIVAKNGRLENDNFIIQFAAGHLVELYQAVDYDESYKNWRNIPFPYIPDPFKMKVKDSAKSLFHSLEKAMNSNDVKEIIVSTDADREGQAIFEYIYSKAKCSKPCKRLWADAFTESGIQKAYSKMKKNEEYNGVKNAGYGRMTSDFLMGALLTAKATIDLSAGKELLNVGRVQTAVLNEICRIENLVTDFKKVKSYQVVGRFKNSKGDIYEGVYDEKFDSVDTAKKLISRLNGGEGKVALATRDEEKKWCPPLFDQTGLAIELAGKYGMSPDQTLAACQSLYEKGYQTYPRTASRYITEGDADDFNRALNTVSSINPLALKYKFSKTNKRIVDDSKVESHGAIVPTESLPTISSLSQNEKNTYTEVILRSIAVNFPPAIDEKHIIDTMIKDIPFHSTGKIEKDRGFREVYNTPLNDAPLPIVNKGEVVQVLNLSHKEVETKPPKRYTEATILKFMESCGKNIENEEARELMKNKGIGTGATRAEIINKLKTTHYIELKGKTIYPTQKGMELINVLPCDELKNPEFTGDLEFKLYQVEKQELSLKEYMSFIEKVYIDSCNKIGKSTSKKIGNAKDVEGGVGVCPACGSTITHRQGKSAKGAYDFYGCSNWKGGCKFSIGDILGKKLTEKQVTQLLKTGTTNEIKGFKKKDGSLLPSAKVIVANKDGSKFEEGQKNKEVEIKLNWN